MQACGRLVARMGEQDVDRDIGAGIQIDGGDMAPVMGDLGDPAIDDRYVAARQIGPDIGRNVVTIGEDRQRVVDQMPDVPGFAQGWGTSIVPCPYCDGFEVAGQHWGLVWSGPQSRNFVRLY